MDSNDRELKIIAKFKNDQPISFSNVMIYLDNEPVGCVQDFNFHVDVLNGCNVEITFPNLKSEKIDKSYYKTPNLVSSVEMHIERLKSILGIKLNLKDIF